MTFRSVAPILFVLGLVAVGGPTLGLAPLYGRQDLEGETLRAELNSRAVLVPNGVQAVLDRPLDVPAIAPAQGFVENADAARSTLAQAARHPLVEPVRVAEEISLAWAVAVEDSRDEPRFEPSSTSPGTERAGRLQAESMFSSIPAGAGAGRVPEPAIVARDGAQEPPRIVQSAPDTLVRTPAANILLGAALAAAPILLWALYSLVRREASLDLPARAAIFERVAAKPGTVPSDLARELSLDLTTVLYHLRRLRREGYVQTSRAGRTTLWWAVGASVDPARVAATRPPVAQKLSDAIHGRPGQTAAEIAQATGTHAELTHWHLRRLAKAGLVRKVVGNGRTRWEPATIRAGATVGRAT